MRTSFSLLIVSLISNVISYGETTPAPAQDLATMKRDYRRPPPLPVANPALAELGRDLFFDPQLSASGKTACASCHFQDLGWGVTDPRSRSDSGTPTSRKSQPLLGIGHAGKAPVGWDGRSPTLEAQVKASVMTGSMSMQQTPNPVKVEVIEERFRSNPGYVAKFQTAMPGSPINIDTISSAIAAFERTLEPKTAPFDRWIEGDEQAISESAKRGFALFNTTKSMCFTCHTGWRFTNDQFHDIGTTTSDPGRGRVVKDDEMMQFAFKTPTLRSVALRRPYMHNASQATLHDVMRHYEKGGIDRPSRSPLMMPISLTDQERDDLVAFMQTLSEMKEMTGAGSSR
ncbi:MAG TPA: cytochrome c peroxidase [Xanthobacteraceae bacterium]